MMHLEHLLGILQLLGNLQLLVGHLQQLDRFYSLLG
jgi:hypothetical protein